MSLQVTGNLTLSDRGIVQAVHVHILGTYYLVRSVRIEINW